MQQVNIHINIEKKFASLRPASRSFINVEPYCLVNWFNIIRSSSAGQKIIFKFLESYSQIILFVIMQWSVKVI